MTEAFTFLHDAVYVDESMPGPGTTADFFAGDSALAIAQVSRAGTSTAPSTRTSSRSRRAPSAPTR